jgi:hypothetical protein
MSQSGDAFGDGSDPLQPQGIDRQASQRRQDLDAVGLPVAVGVFTQRHVTDQVPAVFNRPAVPYVAQQRAGAGP